MYRLGIDVLPSAPTSIIHSHYYAGADGYLFCSDHVSSTRIKILGDKDENEMRCDEIQRLNRTVISLHIITSYYRDLAP